MEPRARASAIRAKTYKSPVTRSKQWPKLLLSSKEMASTSNSHGFSLAHRDCSSKVDATRDEKLVIKQARKIVQALIEGHYIDKSSSGCECGLCELQEFFQRKR